MLTEQLDMQKVDNDKKFTYLNELGQNYNKP